MKTAEEWCEQQAKDPEASAVDWVKQIQRDAYEQGRNDQMAWVSKECLRLTEHLTSSRDQDAKPLFYPPS